MSLIRTHNLKKVTCYLCHAVICVTQIYRHNILYSSFYRRDCVASTLINISIIIWQWKNFDQLVIFLRLSCFWPKFVFWSSRTVFNAILCIFIIYHLIFYDLYVLFSSCPRCLVLFIHLVFWSYTAKMWMQAGMGKWQNVYYINFRLDWHKIIDSLTMSVVYIFNCFIMLIAESLHHSV